tara:strand:+ start:331 stop:903 length:573 start_codon:yes stop_codon:yes gene_type:complete
MDKTKLNFFETKNILTGKEVDFIKNNVMGNNFPWYYQPVATTAKFQFFTHTLVRRDNSEISSDHFYFFENIFNKFCYKHKLKVNKITRAALNLTNPSSYKHGDPHIDHDFKHKVFMLYLNSVEGNTIIFDKKHTKGQSNTIPLEIIKEPFKKINEIKPEFGKAVCWDGNYYHSASYPKKGRRVVAVFTFI